MPSQFVLLAVYGFITDRGSQTRDCTVHIRYVHVMGPHYTFWFDNIRNSDREACMM